MRNFEVRDLGRIGYLEADALQKRLLEQRKTGAVPDQLLFLEHDHVLTMGRNGHMQNLLASPEVLERAGVSFVHTDRGGDVTYHGPGQLVAWPIFDLREWKRDVVAYVRALEQVVMDTLGDFGIESERSEGFTGVWVQGRKVCAIGVHLSRWVTTHGLALNINTDLKYFQYIIPCGLTKPVASMAELGCNAGRDQVMSRLVRHFSRVFDQDASFPRDLEHISRPEAALLTETTA